MANIEVHKGGGDRPAAMAMHEPHWEPLRLMREMLGWDPFREISPLSHAFQPGFAPSFDVKETKDAYVFTADMPGVKESDVEVTVTGHRLTISGRREAEKEERADTYYSSERAYGEFARSFTLPDGVDMGGVQARLAEGVLTVSIKKMPEAQPKKIEVQAGAATAKKT
jgi:HSP20 family protein